MKTAIDRLIQRYGTIASITSGNTLSQGRLFFQLVTSKSWQNMDRMVPSGGEVQRGQFLFIAPAAMEIKDADILRVDNRSFIVRRADPILLGGERLFLWGLCVEGGSNIWPF